MAGLSPRPITVPFLFFASAALRHMAHCASASSEKKMNIAGSAIKMNMNLRFMNNKDTKSKIVIRRDHKIHYHACDSNVKPYREAPAHNFAVLLHLQLQTPLK